MQSFGNFHNDVEAVLRSKALLKAQQPQIEQVIAAELNDFGKLLHSDACQQRLQAFFSRK